MGLIVLAGSLWVAGGGLFLQGIFANRNAAGSRAVLDDLVRLRPAALVAAALFLAVWPAVWIAAHLGSR
ncbi:hypothetical protein ACFSQQ_16500 [Mesorhizobium kowhaii]|uniref:hypothetical protein n=1 Tax=Mesorhizobium kowhaii TaxID=1300272 RepID=UPI0035EA7FB9